MASLEESKVNERSSLLADPKPSAEVDVELLVPGDENEGAEGSGRAGEVSSSECKITR